jgi:hypothetical protein
MKSNIKIKSNIMLKSKCFKQEFYKSLIPYEALDRSDRDVRMIQNLNEQQEKQMELYLFRPSIFIDIYDE